MSIQELLLSTSAKALNVPRGSVDASFTRLRTAKPTMWSSAGQGRKRPDPTSSDAVNLLLSFMVGGLATESPEAVRIVREAVCASQPPLVGVPENAALAGLLEWLLDRRTQEVPVEIEEEAWNTTVNRVAPNNLYKERFLTAPRLVTGGSLSLYRSAFGWQAIIILTSDLYGELQWDMSYNALDEERLRALVEDEDAAVPDRITEEWVTLRAIDALAAGLRGDEEGVQRALAGRNRVYRHPGREQCLDSGYRPRIDFGISSATVHVYEPDHAWLEDYVARAVLGGEDEDQSREAQEYWAGIERAKALLEKHREHLAAENVSKLSGPGAKSRRRRRR